MSWLLRILALAGVGHGYLRPGRWHPRRGCGGSPVTRLFGASAHTSASLSEFVEVKLHTLKSESDTASTLPEANRQ